MSTKKILTVFGATGNQGGSVIRAVLAHSQLSSTYKVRGVTRDPSKPNAQTLTAHGVECVKADLNDPASLSTAIRGSYAVFAVTNFWESLSMATEVQQGKNIADACLQEGVRHLVWSSLPHVSELSNGTLVAAKHFDGKADVEKYVESVKGDKLIATYFMPGFFMSNVKGMVQPGQDGVPALSLPWDPEKTRVPMFDVVDDTGKYVAGALAAGETDPASVDKRRLIGVSQWRSPNEIVADISRVTGTETKFVSLPPEVFKGFLPEAIAEEMVDTMVLIRDYSYYGKEVEVKQAESDKFLSKEQPKSSWASFLENYWVKGKTTAWSW
ncbi:MAG: hypothetical protein Q9160_007697 [Pyrenula sp. 1 TL-2023]